MTGPFAGTVVSTCSRLVVGCKSPATGTILDSYVGGSFAPELKFAGYDALILTGRAAETTRRLDQGRRRRAAPGREVRRHAGLQVEAALRADLDPQAKIMSNGPAGEHLLPWACLSTDQYHKAGRGGAGALMGAKNVKAIAVRGTGTVTVGADARAFQADVERIHREHVHTRRQLLGPRGGHARARRHGQRRRRDADAQLVARAPSPRPSTSTRPPSSRSRSRTAPVRSAPSAAASSTSSAGLAARVPSSRPSPSAAQLRHRRHGGADAASTPPATTSAWTRSRPATSSASPWT